MFERFRQEIAPQGAIFFTNSLVGVLLAIAWLNSSHILPWVSWHAEWPVFLAAGVLALHMSRVDVFRSGNPFGWRPALAVLAIAAIPAFQWIDDRIKWVGQLATIYLYLSLIVIGFLYARKETQQRQVMVSGGAYGEWLAIVLVVVALVSTGIAIIQALGLWSQSGWIVRTPWMHRPGAQMAQPNHLATFLLMAMVALGYLVAQKRVRSEIAIAVAFFVILGLAVTESRAGMLGFVVLILWWVARFPLFKARTRLLCAAPFLTMVWLAYAVWPYIFRFWWHSSATASSMEVTRIAQSIDDPRLLMWRQLLDASWMHPWFGWGVRDTAEAINAVAHLNVNSLPFSYSHNLALDLVVWIGWPIAVLLILAFVCLWGRCVLAARSPIAWFGVGLVIPFLVHSLLEYPFAYAYLLLPAALGLGYASRVEGNRSFRPHEQDIIKLYTWRAFFLIYCVVGLVSAWDYIRVEEDFRIARFQMLRIGSPPETSPPKIFLLDQLGVMVNSTRIPISVNLTGEELEKIRDVALSNPWAGAQTRYIMALTFTGRREEAVRQMQVLGAQHGRIVEMQTLGQINEALMKEGLPLLSYQSQAN